MSAEASQTWYATHTDPIGQGARTRESVTTGVLDYAEVSRIIANVEDVVAASPDRCFTFDETGVATLHVAGQRYQAGLFTVPSIAELREQASSMTGEASGRVKLSVLLGRDALIDIGTLQATAPEGTIFQVASQFNCLESPDPCITPVAEYAYDPTQGPRASVCAYPATLLRHYRAPAGDGTRFVQTDDRCLNLLADAFGPELAQVQAGYLMGHNVRDPEGLANALRERFDNVRVGVHDHVEVVFGHNWGGPVPRGKDQRIAQVLTSTIALGGYSRGEQEGALALVRRQLLRAAYLGTLLAAVALGKHTVVLTLIGGGAFGNPLRDIWDAIHWALREIDPLVGDRLHVVVNARESLGAEDRRQITKRCGSVHIFPS